MLSRHFEVEGIPTLVILDENRNVITDDGRAAVGADPQGLDFPWRPKALNPLNDGAQSSINDFPFLVAETDGSDAAVQAAKEALQVSTYGDYILNLILFVNFLSTHFNFVDSLYSPPPTRSLPRPIPSSSSSTWRTATRRSTKPSDALPRSPPRSCTLCRCSSRRSSLRPSKS